MIAERTGDPSVRELLAVFLVVITVAYPIVQDGKSQPLGGETSRQLAGSIRKACNHWTTPVSVSIRMGMEEWTGGCGTDGSRANFYVRLVPSPTFR